MRTFELRVYTLRTDEKRTGKVLLSMPFSVMAGLVPAIHVVRLARGPNV